MYLACAFFHTWTQTLLCHSMTLTYISQSNDFVAFNLAPFLINGMSDLQSSNLAYISSLTGIQMMLYHDHNLHFTDFILVYIKLQCLALLLLNMTCPVLANSVDPDQLASEEEANWSGSALFVIKCVNFYQKLGSSNLIGWKLEVGIAILIY